VAAYGSLTVTQPIFLLVGRRERVPPIISGFSLTSTNISTPAAWIPPGWYNAADPRTFPNYQDLGNCWVTINPQTGLTATAELAVVPSGGTVTDSRKFAREVQSMGGK
jgi:hypothetical protein